MDRKTGREVALDLADFFNGARPKEIDEFVKTITENVHRTVQQRIMVGFVGLVKKYASLKSGQYDMRNEATVELCKSVESAVDPVRLILPCI